MLTSGIQLLYGIYNITAQSHLLLLNIFIIHIVEPNPPRSLVVVTKTATTMSLSWTQPQQTAAVDGYIVTRKNLDNDNASPVTRDSSDTMEDFNSLTPGATYRIEVKSFKNDHNNQRRLSTTLTDTVTTSK